MANINRYRYGETRPVVGRTNEGVGIEIGDLVYQETDDIRPASAIPDQGSLVLNQRYFACRFLGHASQQHRANNWAPDNRSLRVNTAGIHEYDCAALTSDRPLGTLFGVAENTAGTALLDQTVIEVPVGADNRDERAIGRLARRANSGDTTVYIELFSGVMAGGTDADTCSGSSSGA